MTFVLNIV